MLSVLTTGPVIMGHTTKQPAIVHTTQSVHGTGPSYDTACDGDNDLTHK